MGKLKQDVPGNGLCKHRARLFGANFPLQLHGEDTKCRSREGGVKEWTGPIQGAQDYPGPKIFPHSCWKFSIRRLYLAHTAAWDLENPSPGKASWHSHASLREYNLTNLFFHGLPLPTDHICDPKYSKTVSKSHHWIHRGRHLSSQLPTLVLSFSFPYIFYIFILL